MEKGESKIELKERGETECEENNGKSTERKAKDPPGEKGREENTKGWDQRKVWITT